MFLNRQAGFIIKLIGKPNVTVGERIPYESYPSEISDIKRKWDKLMKSVIEKWEADKSEIEVFKV